MLRIILVSLVLFTTLSIADIVASAPKPPARPSLPIIQPIIERPIERPIERNFNYRPDQYYNYNINLIIRKTKNNIFVTHFSFKRIIHWKVQSYY